jgi:hypothetical protein
MAEFKLTEEHHIKSPKGVLKWEPGEKPSEFAKRCLAAAEEAT